MSSDQDYTQLLSVDLSPEQKRIINALSEFDFIVHGDIVMETFIKHLELKQDFKSVRWNIITSQLGEVCRALVSLGMDLLGKNMSFFNPKGYPHHIHVTCLPSEISDHYDPRMNMVITDKTDEELISQLRQTKMIISLDGIKYQKIPSLETLEIVFRCDKHHSYEFSSFLKEKKFDCNKCALLSVAFDL